MGYYYIKKRGVWEARLNSKYLGVFKDEDDARNCYEDTLKNLILSNLPSNHSEYRFIPDYDEKYIISKDGNVLSLYNGKVKSLTPILMAGYLSLRLFVNGKTKSVSLHRLLYSTFVGKIPDDMVIDHIDRNKLNNNLNNLRLVTMSQNQMNSDRNDSARGTSYHKRDKLWYAKIRIGRKQIHLGCFKTEQEAYEAYVAGKRKILSE